MCTYLGVTNIVNIFYFTRDQLQLFRFMLTRTPYVAKTCSGGIQASDFSPALDFQS